MLSWNSDSPIVAVDFETYYSGEYSVSKLGNWAYTHHPKFNAYLISVSDGVNTIACRPQEFPWETIDGKYWVSHNREFDRSVYERLVNLGEAAPVAPKDWFCSSAACAYLQLPRDLAGACKIVLGVGVDKKVRASMSGKVPGFLSEELLEYAKSDAVLCFRLWEKVGPRWPRIERDLFELTASMGRRGIHVDQEYLADSKQRLEKIVKDCDEGLPFQPPTSIKAFKDYCKSLGIEPPASTADDDFRFQNWLEKNLNGPVATWVRIMQRRRSANRTLKVLDSIKSRINDQGRMVYELKYFGANPGRWSGGGGLNIQNLNRGEVEGIDLRANFCAAPGKILGIVDYAQIESRVVLFLAGDLDTLELLKDGMDIYEAHARATMGYNDPRPLKEVDKGMRQLAKARVLGLGFGCGSKKFIEVARIMGGIEISFEESERIVREYRDTNPKVIALWSRLEDCFRKCHGKDYHLALPCNRLNPSMRRHLIYRNVDAETMSCDVAGDRVNVYGGRLTENWTQATARDVLASAWLRCHAAGYSPVMSVHDELVFELDERTAGEDLEKILDIMEAPRPWAPVLPLKAEGHLAQKYEK